MDSRLRGNDEAYVFYVFYNLSVNGIQTQDPALNHERSRRFCRHLIGRHARRKFDQLER